MNKLEKFREAVKSGNIKVLEDKNNELLRSLIWTTHALEKVSPEEDYLYLAYADARNEISKYLNKPWEEVLQICGLEPTKETTND